MTPDALDRLLTRWQAVCLRRVHDGVWTRPQYRAACFALDNTFDEWAQTRPGYCRQLVGKAAKL